MKKIVSSLILFIFISSCYTERKAERILDRVNKKRPDIVAKKSAEWFPVTGDTIYKEILNDSVRVMFLTAVDTLIVNTRDTVIQNKLIRAKEIIKEYRPVDRIVRVVDSANSKAFRLKSEKLEMKVTSMTWWIIGILLFINLILLIILVKK